MHYDVNRLTEDLQSAVSISPWFSKPERGKYFGWSAIPLVALPGSSGPASVDEYIGASMVHRVAPTSTMQYCPYVREILDSWRAPKTRVRFMRLIPGGSIGRHRDPCAGWQQETIRLHIPVITHPDVKFLLDGTHLDLRPGELWYLDTTLVHEVHNLSTINRIHLVVDLLNTKESREQLVSAGWEWRLVDSRP
jgi:hypothetical protein